MGRKRGFEGCLFLFGGIFVLSEIFTVRGIRSGMVISRDLFWVKDSFIFIYSGSGVIGKLGSGVGYIDVRLFRRLVVFVLGSGYFGEIYLAGFGKGKRVGLVGKFGEV